jgi:hypothetical protein
MTVVAFEKPVETFGAAKDGWMQTLTGRKVFPLRMTPAMISIEDIAGSLSKMCRYAGHCERFYSVAEHCVHVARHARTELKLTALLHDASEAYLVDVPRPLKPFLPGYYEIEESIALVVAQRFGLIHPLPPEVKMLDNAILRDEREQNMAPMDEPPAQWGDVSEGLGVKLGFWDPREAQHWFMRSFSKYGGQA